MRIEEAVSLAKSQYLRIPGIIGIGHDGKSLIFYVEKEEDINKVPGIFSGFPVKVVVSGRFEVF